MTTHTLEQAINNLTKEIQMNHFSNVKDIDNKLAEIMAFNNYLVIRPLARLLEDNAQNDEAIFSIIHSIESFDDDVYIHEIINEFPYLVSKSPYWTTILLIRILNSDIARKCIIEKVEFDSIQKEIEKRYGSKSFNSCMVRLKVIINSFVQ